MRHPSPEMVYIGIPPNYTISPSSFSGTPTLHINHEATQGLDSSNAFEGMLQWFCLCTIQLYADLFDI